MCDVSDASAFAAQLSTIILLIVRFQFFLFVCHSVQKMVRRFLR